MWHIRQYAHRLFSDSRFYSGSPDKGNIHTQINRKLRKIFILFAILYGCVQDGSLWLGLLDHLLEELAEHVIGNTDPVFQTMHVEKMKSYLKTGQRMPMSLSNTRRKLSNQNLATSLFAELALFVRGTAILLFMAVSKGGGRRVRDPRMKEWYDQLNILRSMCGHPSCNEVLDAELQEDAGTQSWGLSVGVLDARRGVSHVR